MTRVCVLQSRASFSCSTNLAMNVTWEHRGATRRPSHIIQSAVLQLYGGPWWSSCAPRQEGSKMSHVATFDSAVPSCVVNANNGFAKLMKQLLSQMQKEL